MIMKIKKYLLSAIAMLLFSGMAFSQIAVSVDPASEVGPIKPMNAANNGPNGPTFKAYKALRVPYGRTHDTPLGEVWSSHVVDINQIFPDWNANVNNPKSYDFDLTDEMLQDMIKAGTEPFFRLGQSIEHESKKYGIYPPKDYKKWAKICEHTSVTIQRDGLMVTNGILLIGKFGMSLTLMIRMTGGRQILVHGEELRSSSMNFMRLQRNILKSASLTLRLEALRLQILASMVHHSLII